MRSLAAPLALVVALTGALACTAGPPASTTPPATTTPAATVTIYSGRSEELVGPLIARFETETGIQAEVRYADTAELASLILEEGANSPADVYFAQDAGALGAVADEGRLRNLPGVILDRVPNAFRSPSGQWVGISGRARVVAYDTRDIAAGEMPSTIDAFTGPEWRGRIGWAPTNGSFQAFVTAYRLLRGDDAARAWLEGIQANEPRTYEGNTQIVQGIADGEVDVGFVNHYYLLRFLAEHGETFPVRNHFLSSSDPGALVNVAGAGILASTDAEGAAQQFIEFLLSDESQAYFSTETFEYPLVPGVDGPEGLPALDQIQSPDINLSDLSDLQATLAMLNETGVLP